MKKSTLALALALSMGISAVCAASPAVTSNVPMDSKYYRVLDKLEGMSFVEALPATKPYSRLFVAQLVKQVELNRQYCEIPAYLVRDYEEMKADLDAELAALENEDAQISNFKFREAKLEATAVDNPLFISERRQNALVQPMNANKEGLLYADGVNTRLNLRASGSISKDLAVGLDGRYSFDKNAHSKTRLAEGYVKTHLGVWGIEVGKENLQWGGAGHNSAFVYGMNAEPHTMVRLNLLQDHEFNNGMLRFLGKGNINVFYAEMEGNRKNIFENGWVAGKNTERDDLKMIGLRADIKPNEHWTIGVERVSILKDIDSDWITGHNKESAETENNNDIGGFDTRVVFPGVQFYASAYGEDQAGHLPSQYSFSGGIFFPQLAKDGSWDLRLEAADGHKSLYGHGTYKNGWSYKWAPMGDMMGGDSRKYMAEFGHYLHDGARLELNFTYFDMNRSGEEIKDKEITLSYEKNINKNLDITGKLGYAKVDFMGDSQNMKLASVVAKWKF